jgi:hypothetical protein
MIDVSHSNKNQDLSKGVKLADFCTTWPFLFYSADELNDLLWLMMSMASLWSTQTFVLPDLSIFYGR